jgi:hypothetical protein
MLQNMFFCVVACDGLQWTSNVTLPDNLTIPSCDDQDITLNWDYVQDPNEQIVNIEWRFRPANGKQCG